MGEREAANRGASVRPREVCTWAKVRAEEATFNRRVARFGKWIARCSLRGRAAASARTAECARVGIAEWSSEVGKLWVAFLLSVSCSTTLDHLSAFILV